MATADGASGQSSASAPDPEMYSDLVKPETSNVLRSILEEVQSEDGRTRLLAINRVKTIFQPYVRRGAEDRVKEAIIFLLERGLMKAIHQALEESAAGAYLLIGETTKKLGSQMLVKPLICINAIECLTIDNRTTSLVLEASPCLPALLKDFFSARPRILGMGLISYWPQLAMREAIMQAFVGLTHSEAVTKELGQSPAFLVAMMEYTMQNFQNPALVNHFACMIQFVSPHCFDSLYCGAVEDTFLHFAAKIFLESSNKKQIICTMGAFLRFVMSRYTAPERTPKPFHEIPGLRSSVLALFVLQWHFHASDEDSRRRWLFEKLLEHVATLAAKDILGCVDAHYTEEDIKRVAQKDPVAMERAEQLRPILCTSTLGEWAPVTSAHDEMVREDSQKCGLTIEKRSLETARRCSRPGCERVEERPGEFRRCGACKRVFYCGPDCQKRAWKAGHKKSCRQDTATAADANA